MNYININFPKNLAKCFCGGVEFSTNIATSAGKQEVRKSNWSNCRYKYKLLYNKCSDKTFQELQVFFLICGGRRKSFNFMDNNDNRIENQLLATGDGATKTFQIYKEYSYGNFSIKRNIYKVENVKIYFNQTLIDSENYSITGNVITFTENCIPTQQDKIYIDCTFYVIVRFDNDFLPVVRKSNNLVELPEITLVEVKE